MNTEHLNKSVTSAHFVGSQAAKQRGLWGPSESLQFHLRMKRILGYPRKCIYPYLNPNQEVQSFLCFRGGLIPGRSRIPKSSDAQIPYKIVEHSQPSVFVFHPPLVEFADVDLWIQSTCRAHSWLLRQGELQRSLI